MIIAMMVMMNLDKVKMKVRVASSRTTPCQTGRPYLDRPPGKPVPCPRPTPRCTSAAVASPRKRTYKLLDLRQMPDRYTIHTVVLSCYGRPVSPDRLETHPLVPHQFSQEVCDDVGVTSLRVSTDLCAVLVEGLHLGLLQLLGRGHDTVV